MADSMPVPFDVKLMNMLASLLFLAFGAMLLGAGHAPIASGSYEWENRYENGLWTYHIDEVWAGLQASYRELAGDVQAQYGVPLRTVGALLDARQVYPNRTARARRQAATCHQAGAPDPRPPVPARRGHLLTQAKA